MALKKHIILLMPEKNGDTSLALAILDKQMKVAEKIDNWIHEHPGEISIQSLSQQLGVEEDYCRRMVESNPDVITTIDTRAGTGHQRIYTSIALPTDQTATGTMIRSEEERAKDKLGNAAVDDYFNLIRERSLSIHQGSHRRKDPLRKYLYEIVWVPFKRKVDGQAGRWEYVDNKSKK